MNKDLHIITLYLLSDLRATPLRVRGPDHYEKVAALLADLVNCR